MIDVNIYPYVYLVFVFVLTYMIVSKYYKVTNGICNNDDSLGIITFWIVLFMTVFFGLRPISSFFGDMATYNATYYAFYYGRPFFFSWSLDNFLFDNLFAWMGSMKFNVSWFFLIIAAIYIGGIAWASKIMFPQAALLAFVMYLGAFSTFSYGVNGIKAGAAASIFLVALAYKSNAMVCIPLLWGSLGFHHSMLAPIVAFAIAFFYRKPKYYLYGWLLCLLLAAAHVTYFMEYFSGFTDDHGAEYFLNILHHDHQ